MRIGVVDLDTSHPKAWIPILRELGHQVVGVWDGGSVHPKGYAETFAKENDIPRVFASPTEMAGEVDCAILHGCDWDTHVEKARPFVEAKRAILIDKPIAGNLKDLRQLGDWVKSGIRITGGSSLRYCYETRDYLEKPVDERGIPHTVFCGCGVDEFNYGIHAYSMLSGILGPGISRVRHLGNHVQDQIEVSWEDGRKGLLVVGDCGNWIPFHATIVTEKSCTHYLADAGKLYRALLERVLPYLSGEAEPPLPFDGLIEPELTALAARKSALNHDQEVHLSSLAEGEGGFDGPAFAESYKQAKYGPSK